MVSGEVIEKALAALSVAAAELVEDHHDELVTTLPRDRQSQLERMQRLHRLGAHLSLLGEAGLVLLGDRSDHSGAGSTPA